MRSRSPITPSRAVKYSPNAMMSGPLVKMAVSSAGVAVPVATPLVLPNADVTGTFGIGSSEYPLTGAALLDVLDAVRE
jgi:hypothetical protein